MAERHLAVRSVGWASVPGRQDRRYWAVDGPALLAGARPPSRKWMILAGHRVLAAGGLRGLQRAAARLRLPVWRLTTRPGAPYEHSLQRLRPQSVRCRVRPMSS